MNIKITRGQLKGSVNMISSKSDGHRLMIAAALADASTEIAMQGISADIEATALCLKSLGAKIEKRNEHVWVAPVAEHQDSIAVLDCNESGSTLRFLLPVAAALGRSVLIEGQGRLPERPISVLTELLADHGCYISQHQLPLEMSGQLQGGIYCLPGNISSQFITGLLFALPILEKDSDIILTTAIESRGYIDMTLHTLHRFGIVIEENEKGFHIPGKQMYHSPKEISAEGDWSNAAFWLAAGAMNESITCKGLQMDSAQGDKQILQLLQQFGANVEMTEDSVTVSHGDLQGCQIDVSQIPDLTPILCMVAAMAEGKTEIVNAGRLRIKESDRIAAMANCLRQLGVNVAESSDGIVIWGGQPKEQDGAIRIDAYNDHRIVMTAAVGAAVMGREAVIVGAEAVAKSYPSFFAEFIRLGGGADVL